MPVKIRQIGPCFAGEVEGIDMRRPLSAYTSLMRQLLASALPEAISMETTS